VKKYNDIDVLILVGGLGTRLKSISKSVPKPLVKINDRPFLSILLKHITSFGFKRIILCTGYKSNAFNKFLKKEKFECEILISKEREPLGTGGAIKNAEKLLRSKSFLVINGDSFCDINLEKFCLCFKTKKLFAQIAIFPSKKTKDFATIQLDKDNYIVNYQEKINLHEKRTSLISTGIYQFSSRIMKFIEADKYSSLEFDILPNIMKHFEKKIYGFVTEGKFIDIGTPESYEKSKTYLM